MHVRKERSTQLFCHGKHASEARAPNDDAAQHGGLIRVNTKSLHAWFTACIFDSEHSCYGQLTRVKSSYLLTSVM